MDEPGIVIDPQLMPAQPPASTLDVPVQESPAVTETTADPAQIAEQAAEAQANAAAAVQGSPEAAMWEKRYNDLHVKFTQATQGFNEKLRQLEAAVPKQPSPEEIAIRTVDKQIAELTRQIKADEVDRTEGLITLTDLKAQKATILAERQATQRLSEMSREKDDEVARKAFLDNNPDYLQFYENGQIQAEIEQNPFLNAAGAYYSIKAKQGQAALLQAQEAAKIAAEQAKVLGKVEQAKLQKGAAVAQGGVLSGQGATVRTATQSAEKFDPVQSGLAALQAARANMAGVG